MASQDHVVPRWYKSLIAARCQCHFLGQWWSLIKCHFGNSKSLTFRSTPCFERWPAGRPANEIGWTIRDKVARQYHLADLTGVFTRWPSMSLQGARREWIDEP
jgi:hypothetical protein